MTSVARILVHTWWCHYSHYNYTKMDSCPKTLYYSMIFWFSVYREECHFSLISCTNLILSLFIRLKLKIITIQKIKESQESEIYVGWLTYKTTSPRIRFLPFFISGVSLTQRFISVQRGINMAAVKYQKHLPLRFAIEKKNYSSRRFRQVEINTSSHARIVLACSRLSVVGDEQLKIMAYVFSQKHETFQK